MPHTTHKEKVIKDALSFLKERKKNRYRSESNDWLLKYKSKPIRFSNLTRFSEIHNSQVIHIKRALNININDQIDIIPLLTSVLNRYLIVSYDQPAAYLVGRKGSNTVKLVILFSNLIELLNEAYERFGSILKAHITIDEKIKERQACQETRLLTLWKRDRNTILEAMCESGASFMKLGAYNNHIATNTV